MFDPLFDEEQDQPKPIPKVVKDMPPLLAEIFTSQNEAFYRRMAEKHGGRWLDAWEKSVWNPKNRTT
jgi:hypothetical protein